MESNKLTIAHFHPRYWLSWLGILGLFLISLLPFPSMLFLGRLLGRASAVFAKKRGHIARTNIALCFPELSEKEVEEKVRLNFENTGIGLFEMAMAGFWPSWRVRNLLKVRGIEHVNKATINGQGMIFLGAHFLTLEMGSSALGITHPSSLVYRKHSNPVLDYWFYRGRIRENKALIDRKDFKNMLRTLKTGGSLWYAPDHDYGKHKSSVFAPFFAVENANTITGTSTLARVKNTCVLPMFLRRLPGTEGYELIFYPPLENFPSDDIVADTKVTNEQIGKMIMECDDQYMWMHRRFKTRPEGEKSVY